MNKKVKDEVSSNHHNQNSNEDFFMKQAKEKTLLALNEKKEKMVPVQFYMTKIMKKRLKMYCLSNDQKMTDTLNKIVNDFLISNGF